MAPLVSVVACFLLLQGATVTGDVEHVAVHPESIQAVAHIEEGDGADEAFKKADLDGDTHLDLPEFRTYYHHSSLAADQGDATEGVPIQFQKTVEDVEKMTMPFWSALMNSVAMIIVTELGDKTFFIAAIMAMRHPRMIIYIGAMGALALMTVLSAAIGFALPTLIPRKYTHWASTVLFVYFGFKLLHEAYEMDPSSGTSSAKEELEEVEQELAEKDGDVEEGTVVHRKSQIAILTQAFTLTFLAEWGDRSQIATIALASAKDPYGVTLGGVIGHGFCTGLAVIGGRLLATRISERTVALSGGLLFWVFAIHSLWAGP